MSEKFDGQRCFWDGGISRGLLKEDVPWANTGKDDRYTHKEVATGLWSRYGNVIHAPDSFLDPLPHITLDGELWLRRGEGGRQELSEVVKKLVPGPGWDGIKYLIIDSPPLQTIFADGVINTTNFKKRFSNILSWIKNRGYTYEWTTRPTSCFESVCEVLSRYVERVPQAVMIPQHKLPFKNDEAVSVVQRSLTQITDEGGEGLVIRHPTSSWVAERSWNLLKVKKLSDAEGIVTGYISGRETDKGSKLLGMMGALVVEFNGKRLELSGFTDDERTLCIANGGHSDSVQAWATANPGQEVPSWIDAGYFPRGTRVTFRYRGLSKDGIPQEARYWRKRDER